MRLLTRLWRQATSGSSASATLDFGGRLLKIKENRRILDFLSPTLQKTPKAKQASENQGKSRNLGFFCPLTFQRRGLLVAAPPWSAGGARKTQGKALETTNEKRLENQSKTTGKPRARARCARARKLLYIEKLLWAPEVAYANEIPPCFLPDFALLQPRLSENCARSEEKKKEKKSLRGRKKFFFPPLTVLLSSYIAK